MQNNRTIKFRAWDVKNKGWVYLYLEENGRVRFSYDKLESCNSDDIRPWQQFTGLTDKNGKEVWEGDIVVETDRTDIRYVVKFTQGGFWLDERDNEMGWPDREEFVVIGNIYEHPELLDNK